MHGPSTVDPVRILVVGGIGAGKSTVLARLARLGAHVIEADRIGHDVLEPWGSAFGPVAELWPHVVVNGEIDRAALAAIVFQDPDELAALEAISHPAIAREIARQSEEAEDAVVAVEVPVEADLVGPGWVKVAVVAPRDVRLARAEARGMERNDAEQRADRQADDAVWVATADEVIVNDGSLEGLDAAVDALWERLVGEVPDVDGRFAGTNEG